MLELSVQRACVNKMLRSTRFSFSTRSRIPSCQLLMWRRSGRHNLCPGGCHPLTSDSHDVSDTVTPCQECKDSPLLSTSPRLDVTTLPSTSATSNVQTDVESPQLDASVSFTFPRPLGVPVAVLFAVGSEGLATALKSEGFVVLHISEPTGGTTRSSADIVLECESGKWRWLGGSGGVGCVGGCGCGCVSGGGGRRRKGRVQTLPRETSSSFSALSKTWMNMARVLHVVDPSLDLPEASLDRGLD